MRDTLVRDTLVRDTLVRETLVGRILMRESLMGRILMRGTLMRGVRMRGVLMRRIRMREIPKILELTVLRKLSWRILILMREMLMREILEILEMTLLRKLDWRIWILNMRLECLVRKRWMAVVVIYHMSTCTTVPVRLDFRHSLTVAILGHAKWGTAPSGEALGCAIRNSASLDVGRVANIETEGRLGVAGAQLLLRRILRSRSRWDARADLRVGWKVLTRIVAK